MARMGTAGLLKGSAWALASLVAACASPTPSPSVAHNPSVIAPTFAAPAQRDSTPSSTPSVQAPDLPWEHFFTEPRLQTLIRIALEHNRDLRIAALNVEQARAQAVIRDADLWPTLNAALGGTRPKRSSS